MNAVGGMGKGLGCTPAGAAPLSTLTEDLAPANLAPHVFMRRV